jgi:hypothetical protein
VVFGGFGGLLLKNDVWALSLEGSPTWTQVTPAGMPPSAQLWHTAIHDPVRDRMVVFGSGVWALSLAGSPAWAQLTPAGAPLTTRPSHTAIYDPVRDRMVVFGGDASFGVVNEVWDLLWGTPLSVLPQTGSDILALAPAYPNPARSDIAIGFTLPRASTATLRVYDVSGRMVRTLVEGTLPAGSHPVRWDGTVSSGARAQPGLYFYELRADRQKLSRRVVLIE